MTRGIGASLQSKMLRLVGAVALFFSSGLALADTVGFNPSPSIVAPSETFNVDIVGIGFTELSGGVIDLGFDSTNVQINSVTIDPFFDFLPDGGGPAVGDIWSGIAFDVFANAPATGDFTIATINLTAIGSAASSLTILPTSAFFSTTAQLAPILTDGSISAVPVPAAVWLFGSGLLGLIGIARRKSA